MIQDLPKIMLAPMSGVTDLPFRLIARELGARFCFFEMIDAKSLLYRKKDDIEILKTLEKDKPIAAQLLGAEPDEMLRAALKLTGRCSISFLDINCGCPAKKVVKKKAGAALLLDRKKVSRMLKKLTIALKIPVTVKMRIGYDRKYLSDIEEFARACEDSGASMLFVHGRTKAEGYSGDVDYGFIRKVKRSVSIPVFGSGNIFDGPRAKKMLDETGVDGILVARGACGNPWIFREIEDFLAGRKPARRAALRERKNILKKHISFIERYKDVSPEGKLGIMRKVSMWYLKGIPDAAKVRDAICRSKNQKELLKIIATGRAVSSSLLDLFPSG